MKNFLLYFFTFYIFVSFESSFIAFYYFLAKFHVDANCKLFTHETLRSSEARLNVFVRSRSNWNVEVLVFEESGKPEYPEKNLSEQGRNQQQTQPISDTGTVSRTRPHWWEASALTNAPSLAKKKPEIQDGASKMAAILESLRNSHVKLMLSSHVADLQNFVAIALILPELILPPLPPPQG